MTVAFMYIFVGKERGLMKNDIMQKQVIYWWISVLIFLDLLKWGVTTKAKKNLGRELKVPFETVVTEMIEADLNAELLEAA